MQLQPSRRGVLAAGAAGAAALSMSSPPAGALGHPRGGGLGRELSSVVEGYSRWSLHRTGTREEKAALRWVEDRLRRLGGTTGRWTYAYPHYDWSADVRVGRHRIPAVPYFYEGTGRVRTKRPFVQRVTASAPGEDPALRSAIAAAAADGAELALLPVTKPATAAYGAYDGQVAFNSNPDTIDQRSGIPTLIVPGSYGDAIDRHGVDVSFAARITERRFDNVTAWLGTRTPVADPIVVTTPLSGWFTCAAERGTGLAFALALAADLASEQPVFFLGNTGHELDNFGVRAYLEDEFDLTPRAVVHLGASLGAGIRDAHGRLKLAPRAAASSPAAAAVPGLAEHLAAGSFTPTSTFPGEGAEWRAHLGADTPLISFAGVFREFHTPDDLPRTSTSPELLTTAYASIRGAVGDLLAAT